MIQTPGWCVAKVLSPSPALPGSSRRGGRNYGSKKAGPRGDSYCALHTAVYWRSMFLCILCSVHLVEVHFNTRITCNIANLHCNDVQCGASTLDGIVQWLADCGLHCGCQHELVDKAVKFIQPVDVKMAPQLNLAAVFSLVDLNALNKSDIVLED